MILSGSTVPKVSGPPEVAANRAVAVPPAVNFGTAVIGKPVDLAFTIRNVGTVPLTGLQLTKDGPDEDMFSLATSPANAVAPFGTTTFTVRFTPTSVGVKHATWRIASNARSSGVN